MKKITTDIYTHRGYDIIKDEQGIWVCGFLELFPSFNMAKEFINKHLDSTNKIEPKIIGYWHD